MKTILLLLSFLVVSCASKPVLKQDDYCLKEHPTTVRARGLNAEIETYKNLTLSELGFLLRKLTILVEECGDIVCIGLAGESQLKIEEMIRKELRR